MCVRLSNLTRPNDETRYKPRLLFLLELTFSMTYVSGVLHFENNKHRLYSAVDTLSNLVACVSTAVELRLGRTTKWNAGDNVGFDCDRYFSTCWTCREPHTEQTVLAHQIGIVPNPKHRNSIGPNFKNIQSTIIIPLFVQFFEGNREWLDENVELSNAPGADICLGYLNG